MPTREGFEVRIVVPLRGDEDPSTFYRSLMETAAKLAEGRRNLIGCFPLIAWGKFEGAATRSVTVTLTDRGAAISSNALDLPAGVTLESGEGSFIEVREEVSGRDYY